jgi:2-polyprenyl-3-methyl-5-hydroxy-6-metoxy-1,4-benzoquinol methylase
MTETTINEGKLEEFLNTVVSEVGAAYNAVLTAIGDELGLYEALREHGPLTSKELAAQTGTAERYIREWSNTQAASGFLRYHPDSDTYELPPEQAYVLADPSSPVYVPGMFQAAKSVLAFAPARIADGFRTGEGVGWHEHGDGLFEGTERFFRAGYEANLVSSWLPALTGIEDKLRAGARVADVGCGYGASTIIMAKAYPNSTFVGYDYHAASIEMARRRAAEAGVSDRVRFEVAAADEYQGRTTSSHTSTACTTWAIPWPQHSTSTSRCGRTVRGWSSNLAPATMSRTTSTSLGGCTTRSPR